jgi:hypothetical protein
MRIVKSRPRGIKTAEDADDALTVKEEFQARVMRRPEFRLRDNRAFVSYNIASPSCQAKWSASQTGRGWCNW